MAAGATPRTLTGERTASRGCGERTLMAGVRVPVTYQTVRSRCRETVVTGLLATVTTSADGEELAWMSTWPVVVPVWRKGPATGWAMPTSRRMKETAVATASVVLGGRFTGDRGAGWSGVGWSGAGVAGAAIDLAASPGGLVSRVLQPATAMLATRRAAAMVRTGRMLFISFVGSGTMVEPHALTIAESGHNSRSVKSRCYP